ncbi:MAG: glycerophosphodiester phosphodiesterase family protein [Pseudomonadota bacterium]|nr:glycerophosphodiester phosphodiesterase family protein [Pseudomonadota bacterium]
MFALEIGGHRGSGNTDSPHARQLDKHLVNPAENTLESIKAALAAGADFIEIDVIGTRDEHIIVTHSDLLSDHVFGRDDPGFVADNDLAALKALAVGINGDGTMPELIEVLDLIDAQSGDIWLNIEIKDVKGTGKSRKPDFVPLLASVVRNHPLDDARVLFSSFALIDLVEMQQVYPKARLGLLMDTNMKQERPVYPAGDDITASYLHFTPDNLQKSLALCQLAAVHPEGDSVSDAALAAAAEVGLAVNVWYLDELPPKTKAASIRDLVARARLHDLSLGIITDYVAPMRHIVSDSSPKPFLDAGGPNIG